MNLHPTSHSANPRIASATGLAPLRSIAARRVDPAFEVRLQDVHWPSAGQSQLQTGSRCTFELLLPNRPAECATEYSVAYGPGLRRAVGRLNFVAPTSSLELHWSRGTARSIVCLFDPASLGLFGRQFADWRDVDPLAALDIRNPRIEASLVWLQQELLQPSFASPLQITTLLTLLALEAQRHFGARPPDSGADCRRLSPRQLAALKEQIEQAPPAGVALEQLALACGLPGRELPALFKQTVGVTLRSFVAASHIERAKLLLSDPRLLIKQVAGRSGFESASAFTAAFRKATGMRPQQYRTSTGVRAAQPSDSDSDSE